MHLTIEVAVLSDPYAARNATKSKGTVSLKLNRDPLGSLVPE
jgi:hypothetical protein